MCRILRKEEKIDKLNHHNLLSKAELTRANDAIDEDLTRYQAVVVLVHLTEQVCEARFLVIHELQELKWS